jgi:hypothetical protein
MTKHRITIDLDRETELAISDEKDRKVRNLAINEFLLSAMEVAIPAKVRERKQQLMNAYIAKAKALKDELE